MCWVSSIIAILLLYGWKEGEYNQCGYIAVVSKEYLYFRHFLFTIIPCTGLIIISIAILYQIDQVKISYWMLRIPYNLNNHFQVQQKTNPREHHEI